MERPQQEELTKLSLTSDIDNVFGWILQLWWKQR